jgi:hypothetical protein
MAGLETAALRTSLTTLKTSDGMRVVVAVVSGDAGLCIKRQTYPRCGSDEQREVELLQRASDRPRILGVALRSPDILYAISPHQSFVIS